VHAYERVATAGCRVNPQPDGGYPIELVGEQLGDVVSIIVPLEKNRTFMSYAHFLSFLINFSSFFSIR
jgi:hypothetical protein